MSIESPLNQESTSSLTPDGDTELPAEPLPLSTRILAAAVAFILRTLLATLRWRTFEEEKLLGDSQWQTLGPRIIVVWHGHQVLPPALYYVIRRKGFSGRVFALISQHRDGRLAAEAVRRLGIESVAGSSTRGGHKALHKLVELVKSGHVAVITPDGPKGPIYRLKAGPIKLAQLTGVPIYPVALAARSKKILRSWDKMCIPYPFSEAICQIGEKIIVPPTSTEEEFNVIRLDVEKKLQALASSTDQIFLTHKDQV